MFSYIRMKNCPHHLKRSVYIVPSWLFEKISFSRGKIRGLGYLVLLFAVVKKDRTFDLYISIAIT